MGEQKKQKTLKSNMIFSRTFCCSIALIIVLGTFVSTITEAKSFHKLQKSRRNIRIIQKICKPFCYISSKTNNYVRHCKPHQRKCNVCQKKFKCFSNPKLFF